MLPAHRHPFSPKEFTQPQLMACLVLKESSRLDYRGLAEHLADHPDLCTLIGLKVVPHFTTFQKAAQRLLAAAPGREMFDAVLDRAPEDRVRKRRVRLAAIDGTGLESRDVSRYFTKRQADGKPGGDRTYAHFPKVAFVVDCASHMILAAAPGRGPATDLVQFERAWGQAVRRARIEVLLADADFDAEWLHVAVRSHGVRTIIPPTRGRPSASRPAPRPADGEPSAFPRSIGPIRGVGGGRPGWDGRGLQGPAPRPRADHRAEDDPQRPVRRLRRLGVLPPSGRLRLAGPASAYHPTL